MSKSFSHIVPHLTPLRQNLSLYLKLAHLTRLAGQRALRIHPLHLSSSALGIETAQSWGFFLLNVGGGDLNSCSHDYRVSAVAHWAISSNPQAPLDCIVYCISIILRSSSLHFPFSFDEYSVFPLSEEFNACKDQDQSILLYIVTTLCSDHNSAKLTSVYDVV